MSSQTVEAGSWVEKQSKAGGNGRGQKKEEILKRRGEEAVEMTKMEKELVVIRVVRYTYFVDFGQRRKNCFTRKKTKSKKQNPKQNNNKKSKTKTLDVSGFCRQEEPKYIIFSQ